MHEYFDKDIKLEQITRIESLDKKYDSKYPAVNGYYDGINHKSVEKNMSTWLGVENTNLEKLNKTGTYDVVRQMYSGTDASLGLKKISEWKINPEFEHQNLKQHSGFAAEVIGTAKENLKAQIEGKDIRTYRADDLPELFSKNDQYVDKVRINSQGEIVERIQTKFVGENGETCLSKLASKKFDKYINDGKVDKIEIPKDFYDEIRNQDLIGKKIKELENQLKKVEEAGKSEVAESIRAKIEKYNKIDKMIERSTVSQAEALYATKYPKRYAAKLFAKDIAEAGHEAGREAGLCAAAITVTTATVDNFQKIIKGEVGPEAAALDIAKQTGTAGAVGYGTSFISTAIARGMSHSSHKLIQSLSKTGVPAAIVSVGVQSFDSIVDFGHGIIEAKDLAYDIGKNVATVAGQVGGSALAGSAMGSVVPGAGNVAGFVAGAVGGIVGVAVTGEAYKTAVKVGAKGVGKLEEKLHDYTNHSIKSMEQCLPEKVVEMKHAIAEYFEENEIPIQIEFV